MNLRLKNVKWKNLAKDMIQLWVAAISVTDLYFNKGGNSLTSWVTTYYSRTPCIMELEKFTLFCCIKNIDSV